MRAAETRVTKLRAENPGRVMEDAKPDWRRWAITVGEVTVAYLPRGASEVTWTKEGLAGLAAQSGTELMAAVVGR